MSRDFNAWLSGFRNSIADYGYYIDFQKVHRNVETIKVELNILNFYGSGGSKLNETARSYKTLAWETEEIDGFTFVWFTDGKGWISARNNLEETFDVMQHIYNIKDLEEGIIGEVFK